MAADTGIKVGGVWKSIADAGIKVGGVWKQPTSMKIKVAGVWKEVWAALSLAASPIGGNIYNFRLGINCYSGLSFNSNGVEYWCTNSGSFTTNKGAWMDSGAAGDYWVQFVVTSGSFNSINPGTGRLNLATTRQCRIVDTTTSGGSVTCSFTANFYDAASGGNLVGSASYTLSALKSL